MHEADASTQTPSTAVIYPAHCYPVHCTDFLFSLSSPSYLQALCGRYPSVRARWSPAGATLEDVHNHTETRPGVGGGRGLNTVESH